MQKTYEHISGKRYDMLMLTGKCYMKKSGKMVECICDCGNIKWVRFNHLVRGNTFSCGCLKVSVQWEIAKKNGVSGHPLFKNWYSMIRRCYNHNSFWYYLYGGSGVTVCDEWRHNFMSFYNWAIINGYKKGLQLDKDKLSPNKTGMIYCPEYCCYLTGKENSRHTRANVILEYKGETKTLVEWCEVLNIPYSHVQKRIKYKKWSVEKSFETPFKYYDTKLTAFGESKYMPEWIKDNRCVIGISGLRKRLEKGWEIEVALTTIKLK